MKDQLINFILTHISHILSMGAYAVIEYRIGLSKNIKENSFLEILKNKLWGNK